MTIGATGQPTAANRAPRNNLAACIGRLAALAATAAAVLVLTAPQPLAQGQSIGVASAVVREVTGNAGGQPRQLSVGAGIFMDETIQTGAGSNSQLMFRDETTLSIGPSSAVVLDRFVYDPSGRASTFSVRAARGALRFVSGSSRPSAYQIRTPVATIGVRGTIVDVFVRSIGTVVVLSEGAADVCVNGACSGLAEAGSYLLVRPGGRVDGPLPWDGRLRSIVGSVSFPLYGWSLDLERGPRYVGEPARNSEIDQIESRDSASFDGPPTVIDEPFEPPLWTGSPTIGD